jgi:hypothetical protein
MVSKKRANYLTRKEECIFAIHQEVTVTQVFPQKNTPPGVHPIREAWSHGHGILRLDPTHEWVALARWLKLTRFNQRLRSSGMDARDRINQSPLDLH